MAVLKRNVIQGTLVLGATDTSVELALPLDLDLSKSVLFPMVHVNGSETSPVESMVRAELYDDAGTPKVRFTRGGQDGALTINCDYRIFEFLSGVNVQRGTTNPASFTTGTPSFLNVTISAVNLSKTFVTSTALKTGSINSGRFDNGEFERLRLTTSTNLLIEDGDNTPDREISWQVIEFTDATNVQKVESVVANGAAIDTQTISAVDLTKTALFLSWWDPFIGSGADDTLLRAQLTSTTQVAVDRYGVGDGSNFNYTLYVVEFENALVGTDEFTITSGSTSYVGTNSLSQQLDQTRTVFCTTGAWGMAISSGNSGDADAGQFLGDFVFTQPDSISYTTNNTSFNRRGVIQGIQFPIQSTVQNIGPSAGVGISEFLIL